MIKNNTVVIFSKTTCPYCAKVKDLFNSLDMKYQAIELDKMGKQNAY